MPIIAAIIAAVKGLSIFRVAINIILFFILKALLVTLFTTVLSYTIYSVMDDIMQSSINAASPFLEDMPDAIIHISGVGAWLANCLRIPEIISVITAGCSFAYARSFLRFL